MRRLLSIFGLMLIALTTMAQKPAISFDTKQHDFGNVDELGGKVTTEFTFTNTGDAPLIIISATASCGCTTPQYPHEPIQPGEVGAITVSYSPAGRPGEFSKNVKVRTNVPGDKKVNLKITGVVIPSSHR